MRTIGLALTLILACCAPAPSAPSAAAPATSSVPTATATTTPTVSGAATTPYPAPTPVGFALPSTCSYVGQPIAGTDVRTWYVDCHASSVADARGPLVNALGQQGWTSCATGPLRALWTKGTTLLTITESPGGDTQLAQSQRAGSPCP